MSFTFRINDISNPKAKAFLEYIKTLDFVIIDSSKEYLLTEEQIIKVNERRADRLTNKSNTHC